jgi:hypothetical protein
LSGLDFYPFSVKIRALLRKEGLMGNDFARLIIKECRKRGIPISKTKKDLTPDQLKRMRQIERDVEKFVMGIEEAHKKASKSKLFFGKGGNINGRKQYEIPASFSPE